MQSADLSNDSNSEQWNSIFGSTMTCTETKFDAESERISNVRRCSRFKFQYSIDSLKEADEIINGSSDVANVDVEYDDGCEEPRSVDVVPSIPDVVEEEVLENINERTDVATGTEGGSLFRRTRAVLISQGIVRTRWNKRTRRKRLESIDSTKFKLTDSVP